MAADTNSAHPFVDFYRSLDISPVKQDISDLRRHYQRRDSLYRSLGILPLVVRGSRVIEFGPGSGYNALYTASLEPQAYTLVDANPRGTLEMRRLFEQHGVGAGVEIVESLVEDFAAPPEFDIVLAEGLIAFQRAPAEFAWWIAKFAKPGGILVVTCSDAVSLMGEIGRRLIAQRIASPALALPQRMEILRRMFAPHLATLSGMSRSVDDWILDNIVQPFINRRLFSVADAIGALGSAFDVYGSSPRFLVDWRWYKDIVGCDRDFNRMALRNYQESLVNFFDYRFEHLPTSAATGCALLAACQTCYDLMLAVEAGQSMWPELLACLRRIITLVEPIQSESSRAIAALTAYLTVLRPETALLHDFIPFFGRSTQYLSFVRRIEGGGE